MGGDRALRRLIRETTELLREDCRNGRIGSAQEAGRRAEVLAGMSGLDAGSPEYLELTLALRGAVRDATGGELATFDRMHQTTVEVIDEKWARFLVDD